MYSNPLLLHGSVKLLGLHTVRKKKKKILHRFRVEFKTVKKEKKVGKKEKEELHRKTAQYVPKLNVCSCSISLSTMSEYGRKCKYCLFYFNKGENNNKKTGNSKIISLNFFPGFIYIYQKFHNVFK